MWRPGFTFEESVSARMQGVHRSLCVLSYVHRGTEDHPGLVLGLDKGGSVRGVAFRVKSALEEETMRYLREREQVNMVYREEKRLTKLADGRSVRAVVYVVDRMHTQYAGLLSREEQLSMVRSAVGMSGHNRDYVLSTVETIEAMGFRDKSLHWLAERLWAEKEKA